MLARSVIVAATLILIVGLVLLAAGPLALLRLTTLLRLSPLLRLALSWLLALTLALALLLRRRGIGLIARMWLSIVSTTIITWRLVLCLARVRIVLRQQRGINPAFG